MRHLFQRLKALRAGVAPSVLFLAALFVFGGTSRTDSLGQLVVVPLALAFVLLRTLRGTPDLLRPRVPSLLVFASLFLVLVQLVPLPPAAWSALPGHGSFAEALTVSHTEAVWRPINLVPSKGWIALAWMLIPVAALMIAVRAFAVAESAPDQGAHRKRATIRPEEKLIVTFIALGVASAILAICQLLGPPGGPLYLHRVTNAGSAVGLFANRNHHAVFLAALFPLLAVCGSLPVATRRAMVIRNGLLLGAMGLFLCIILVSGSRAGLVMGAVALAAAFFIYQHPTAREVRGEEIKLRRLRLALIGAFVVGLGLLTVILSRAQSLDRAIAGDSNVIQRPDIWAVTLRQTVDFFPFGTGFGTFSDAYRMVEPAAIMSRYYINHAHNDWLEVVHDGGIVALILLAIAAVWWCRATLGLLRQGARSTRRGRVGLASAALICVFGMASFVDYPLRTAPLSALFVIGAVWLAMAGERRSTGSTGGGLPEKRSIQ